MIIAVDFDGTLHDGEFPNIGQPMPHVNRVMTALKNGGHTLVINTCRCDDKLINAINWLLANNIPFHRVNDNDPENIAKYGSNSRKVYAHLYVDDKQVGGLPDWLEIYDYILKIDKEYKDSH